MVTMKQLFKLSMISLLVSCVMIITCDSDDVTSSLNDTFKYDHQAVITDDEVWMSDHTHVINHDIYIQDAAVTIEPGAIIRMAENASINVMSHGVLIADGAADSPILFTRQEDSDYWKQIYFSPNSSTGCLLNYCIFEYGGNDQAYPAIIYCDNADVAIMNSTISSSAAYGVYLAGTCSRMKFDNNTIKDNARAPLITAITNLGIIGRGDYLGNADDYIEVNSGALSSDVVLIEHVVPYYFTDNITIRSGRLSIAESCSLLFAEARGVQVVENGALSLNSSGRSIWITGYEKSNGYWQGINIDSKAPSILNNCVIEYGGQSTRHPANISVESGQNTITNCTIRRSMGYGIYVGSDCQMTFLNNIIEENTIAPLSMPVSSAVLISGNQFKLSSRYIELRGGDRDGLITGEVMLDYCEIPYFVTDDIIIKYGSLIVGSGVNLLMADNAMIEVLEGGGFVANGSTRMITITSQSKFSGAWKGIYFGPQIRQTHCSLNFCRIMYGGGDDEHPANIYCDNSSPCITNCVIEQSLGYGIYLAGNASPVLINNTFFSNLLGPTNN